MFLYPLLLTGFALVGLPILIHLINMLRHRRVQWAAMEFLLASYKKHSTWIRFKELLLLLTRIAIICAIVLSCAQPIISDQWGNLFGQRKNHVIFLLDDSFSMSARPVDKSNFDLAKQTLKQYVVQQSSSVGQTFSVMTFSRPDQPLFASSPIDQQISQTLDQALKTVLVTERDDGPLPALRAAQGIVESNPESSHTVCLISDFRTRNWLEDVNTNTDAASNSGTVNNTGGTTNNTGGMVNNTGDTANNTGGADALQLHDILSELGHQRVNLLFIDAASGERRGSQGRSSANLAIVSLAAGEGTQAAGVPIPMTVKVANYSTDVVRNVAVRLEVDGKSQPAVVIPVIQPNDQAKANFPISFPQGGYHVVEAFLPSDILELDNHCRAVLNVPPRLSVLLVGKDQISATDLLPTERPDVKFVQAALVPGVPIDTGISAEVQDCRFVNTARLENYKTVWLMNIDQLSALGQENLVEYLTEGGTAVAFLGDQLNTSAWNLWMTKGLGTPDLRVGEAQTLTEDLLRKRADLVVSSHPVFRVFEGEKNAFLTAVRVNRYYPLQGLQSDTKPAINSAANNPAANNSSVNNDSSSKEGSGKEGSADEVRQPKVLARLRNGAPLIVEVPVGKGTMVLFTTTAAPTWNNWAKGNPSYVVVLHQLEAFLTEKQRLVEDFHVGQPVEFPLDQARFRPEVVCTPPASLDTGLTTEDRLELQVQSGRDGKPSIIFNQTDVSGVYRFQFQPRLEGETTGSSAKDTSTAKADASAVSTASPDATSPGATSSDDASLDAASPNIRWTAVNVVPEEGNLAAVDLSELKTMWSDVPFHVSDISQTADQLGGSEGYNLQAFCIGLLGLLLAFELLLAYWAGYHLGGAPAGGTSLGGTSTGTQSRATKSGGTV